MAGSLALVAPVPTGAGAGPDQLGGTTASFKVAGAGASCWGPTSPRRLLTYVEAGANANVTLYRWSVQFAAWIPNFKGAQAVVANTPTELAWETDGVEGFYLMFTSASTGTWQPLPGLRGP